MNINLSPQSLGNLNLSNSVTSVGLNGTQQIDPNAAAALLNSVANMLPGQILEGRIIETEGDNTKLLLNNNLLLNTFIDSDVNLVNGRDFSFEVQSNNDGQLVLRPLLTNTVNEATAVKALEAAGVNVNSDTLRLVESLMKEGMPINKDVIMNLYKDLNLYPMSQPEDIVMLHKLGIEVNEDNLTQINLYRNENSWMIENITSFSQNLVDVLTQTANEGSEPLNIILNNLLNVFDDDTINTETNEKENSTVITFKENDFSESKIKNLFEKISSMPPERLKLPSVQRHLFNEFNKIFSDKMLMEPENVADKEYVKNHYEKLLEFSKDLSEALSQSGKSDSALSKNVDGLKGNLSFINDMNQMYNYIQFPLKMADSQANGDLYVFRRKGKNENVDSDEPLTALLHLSMETLGNMDIYLSLQNDKLSTRFELEKEEMIDFIESHIDELNKRLESKGYSINTSVSASSNESSNVIDLINKEIGTVPVFSINGFDARA